MLATIAILCSAINHAYGLVTSPPQLRCPPDYHVADQHACIRIEFTEFQYDCPKHSKKIVTNGRIECIATESEEAAYICPEGFVPTEDGRECEKVTSVPMRLECDDPRWELQTEISEAPRCVRKSFHAAQLVCPHGFKLDPKHMCVATEKATPSDARCPDNARLVYKKEKPHCELRNVAPADLQCPRGYTVTPNEEPGCHRVEITPQKIDCPRGFRLDSSGVCVMKVEQGSAQVSCARGQLTRFNKRCEVFEQRPPLMTCKKDFQLQDGKCSRVEKTSPSLQCEKGWRLVQSSSLPYCQRRVESVAPIVSCPPGTFQRGDKCFLEERIPAAISCPNGFEPLKPTKKENSEHWHVWEEEDVKNVGSHDRRREQILIAGACVRRLVTAAAPNCPKDFNFDSHGQCVSLQKLSAVLLCPEGSIPRGNLCETSLIVPPEMQCRKGRPDGQNCVELHDKSPRKICPRRFNEEGNNCLRIDRVKSERLCPNSMPKGDRCEFKVAVLPIAICPKGFTVGAAERCQKIHATEPKPFCPRDRHYEGGMCVG